jgi:hypothetical protein
MGDSAFGKVPTTNIVKANITLEIGGTEMSKIFLTNTDLRPLTPIHPDNY